MVGHDPLWVPLHFSPLLLLFFVLINLTQIQIPTIQPRNFLDDQNSKGQTGWFSNETMFFNKERVVFNNHSRNIFSLKKGFKVIFLLDTFFSFKSQPTMMRITIRVKEWISREDVPLLPLWTWRKGRDKRIDVDNIEAQHIVRCTRIGSGSGPSSGL